MTNVYEGYSDEDLDSPYFIHSAGYRSLPGFPWIRILFDGTEVWNAKTERPLSIWYNHNGYPYVTFAGRNWRLQRLVLAAWRPGSLDNGEHSLHRIPDRKFVALWNLRAGTQKENVQDAIRDGHWSNGNVDKTHCPNGHSLSGANLVAVHLKQGRRDCRTCNSVNTKVRDLNRRKGIVATDEQVEQWHEEYYARYIAETLALLDFATHNPQTAMALSA